MKNIYKIYTLCRSGNHAIIYWILHNYYVNRIDVIFLNNINHTPQQIPDEANIVLCSYEDFFPELINNHDFIIIRDFYNTIASRYKLWKPLLGIPDQKYIHSLNEFIDYWKYLAKLSLKSNKYIYYNKWISSKNYRDNILQKLFGISNIADETEFLPKIGLFGGSSYRINRSIKGDISQYLDRYKTTPLPDGWKHIIEKDSEIQSLCDRLNSEYWWC